MQKLVICGLTVPITLENPRVQKKRCAGNKSELQNTQMVGAFLSSSPMELLRSAPSAYGKDDDFERTTRRLDTFP